MLGGPVFFREVLATSRRKRTYVFQTTFLAILVLCLIPPLANVSQGKSGAQIAETGRKIFEYGGYLQVILLALLAPAVTANAITEEKDKQSLELLLLSSAGPFAIVWGKFFSRLFNLVFLLFLTVPLTFAVLTLGGVAASSILIEFVILVCFSVLGAGLGIFLSTVMANTTGVLITGYLILGTLVGLPTVLGAALSPLTKMFAVAPGSYHPVAAYISPFYDLIYVFSPSRFVPGESFPTMWWVCPLGCLVVGLGLTFLAGVLIPHARTIERKLSGRRALEAIDRGFGRLLGVKAKPEQEAADRRPIGTGNPILWKETNVNTVGRFKYWWRINLALLLLMVLSYGLFKPLLGQIDFHKYMVAVLAGLIVLLSTVIATTTVSQEREDTSLVLLATTPVECATYIKGKVIGIARNISFLVALPFVHCLIFVLVGIIHPLSLFLLLLAIPVAVVGSIMQGIFVSLLFTTTLRAILAGIIVVVLESTLPLICCLPTFNLPLTCKFVVEPAAGMGTTFAATSQMSYLTAMTLALVFSAGTQIGYTVVVYSLISSGFDRYIGRAG